LDLERLLECFNLNNSRLRYGKARIGVRNDKTS